MTRRTSPASKVDRLHSPSAEQNLSRVEQYLVARRVFRLFEALPGLFAYQAAKWAVGGFSDVVAKEVAHLGIRVCTLEPGGMRTDWASEARRDDGMLPDYDQSVGKMLRLLEAYGGHEVSDPAKIATLIVQLSRRADLPLRLLLGGDALHVCNLADAERAEELERWREVTLSTHFPDAQLPDGLDMLKKRK